MAADLKNWVQPPTTFMSLPTDVRFKIFDKLGARHLLRLRLTCKKLRNEVDTFPRCPEILQQIQPGGRDAWVRLDAKSVYRFMEEVKSLPFTAFSLQNRSPLMYEHLFASGFVEAYAPKVKLLRLTTMYECRLDSELEFLDSLVNLEYLQIFSLEHLKYSRIPKNRDDLLQQLRRSEDYQRIPKKCLKNLKDVHIYIPNQYETTYDLDFILNRHAKSLNFIRLHGATGPLFRWRDQIIYRLVDYLYFRQDASKGSNVQEITFDHSFVTESDLKAFYNFYDKSTHEEEDRGDLENVKTLEQQFVGLVGAVGIRIKKIHVALLDSFVRWVPHEKFQRFVPFVVSMVGISPIIKRFELPNLIEVDFANGSADLDFRGWDEAPGILPEWPKLTMLGGLIEVKIDPKRDHKKEKAQFAMMQQLVRFLCRGKLRPNLIELMLTFEVDEVEEQDDNAAFFDLKLSPEDICLRFPALKRLDIMIEKFTLQDYVDLFFLLGKHTLLEDLAIIIPESFAGRALFGKDPTNPVFLQLKHLTALSFETNGDALPNCQIEEIGGAGDAEASQEIDTIGDQHVFKIFSQMKLEDFSLYLSDTRHVTARGIISLLKGPFIKTIKSFTLSSTECDDEDEGNEDNADNLNLTILSADDESVLSMMSADGEMDAVPVGLNNEWDELEMEEDIVRPDGGGKNEEQEFQSLDEWTRIFGVSGDDDDYTPYLSAIEAEITDNMNDNNYLEKGKLDQKIRSKAISIVKLFCKKNCLK